MPKPLLLHRPTGLYARFRVPTDLCAAVGSRFLLRPLYLPPGDASRFAAACLGVALSQAFRRLRQGDVSVDIKKMLKDAQNASQLMIGGVRLPNSVELTDVRIDRREACCQTTAQGQCCRSDRRPA